MTTPSASAAEAIIGLYERHSDAWDVQRGAELICEREWIERFMAILPPSGTVLDLGCGSGQPLARHLLRLGFTVVGVDSSPSLIAICRSRFPEGTWILADMRCLALHRRFDGVMAWDSFFHLSHDDQRAMFAIFQDHADLGAPLLFTTGPDHGEVIGTFQGESLYHASLSAAEYREHLEAFGFCLLAHEVEDPDCGHHTVWLARRGNST